MIVQCRRLLVVAVLDVESLGPVFVYGKGRAIDVLVGGWGREGLLVDAEGGERGVRRGREGPSGTRIESTENGSSTGKVC